jgi:hypothetical protein
MYVEISTKGDDYGKIFRYTAEMPSVCGGGDDDLRRRFTIWREGGELREAQTILSEGEPIRFICDSPQSAPVQIVRVDLIRQQKHPVEHRASELLR